MGWFAHLGRWVNDKIHLGKLISKSMVLPMLQPPLTPRLMNKTYKLLLSGVCSKVICVGKKATYSRGEPTASYK